MKRELEQLRNRLQVRRSFWAVAVCERAALHVTLFLWRRVFSCVLVQEESLKVRAETKLDINLESSRISDMVCVCVVTLTHKPDIHIYDVLFSSRCRFERQHWSCRDTERHADCFCSCRSSFCVLLSVHWTGEEADGGHHRVSPEGKYTKQVWPPKSTNKVCLLTIGTNDPVPWLVVVSPPIFG